MPKEYLTSEEFQKIKKKFLSKEDKSNEGKWDEKIISLCKKINRLPDYFTTSSCAGRIMLIKGKLSKIPNVFLFKTHSTTTPEELKQNLLKNLSEDMIYFKQDPCALHVACRTLDHALALLKIARNIGWKKSGIISSRKRYICEMTSTESVVCPIASSGKILTTDKHLNIIVKEANKKLKRTWSKIEKLEQAIESLKLK